MRECNHSVCSFCLFLDSERCFSGFLSLSSFLRAFLQSLH
nr:MAG TPA: hypothetical protein [Bacteriophage sp.]